jgi:hypothetical protein
MEAANAASSTSRQQLDHGYSSVEGIGFNAISRVNSSLQLPTIIEAMRQQEENHYAIQGDYLAHRDNGYQTIQVDYGKRESMPEWAYKVVEFLEFGQETVEIAMNFLDRFLLKGTGSDALACTKLFQLAAMSCLYLSIKCHEEIVLDSKFMANLSQGLFTYEQVEDMELKVLSALGFRVNPPTALAFVREFLELTGNVSSEMKSKAYALCEPQVQIAVIDHNFINVKASTIALFALLNSLKVLGMDMVLLNHIGSLLAYASRIDQESLDEDIQDRLYDAVVDYSDLTRASERDSSVGISPAAQKDYTSQRASCDGSPCGVFS